MKYLFKFITIIASLLCLLLISSLLLNTTIQQRGEKYSELYLLDSDRTTKNYPYTTLVGKNYSVYVCLTNHLGFSSHYVLYLRILNETDRYPNIDGKNSNLTSSLYEHHFILKDGETVENQIIFSISNAVFFKDSAIIKTFIINNKIFDINKTINWNSTSTEFSYTLIFELWKYDFHGNNLEFDDRYVILRCNLTNNILD